MTGRTLTWTEANQHYLMAALAVLQARVEARVAPSSDGDGAARQAEAERNLESAATALPAPAALEMVVATFGLSPFERDLLLMCAGVELSSAVGTLCARANGDPSRPYPTLGMALAVLDQAHWSAIVPAAPLRRWRLVELGPGGSLTTSPLRIDERVLHYLAGVQHLDERLEGLLERAISGAELAASHRALGELVIRHLAGWHDRPSRPIVQLCGRDRPAKRAIAASACATIGVDLFVLPADDIPASPSDADAVRRLCDREAALTGLGLLLDAESLDPSDRSRLACVSRFVERLMAPLLVAAREPLPLGYRASVRVDVSRPSACEQRSIWQGALGPALADQAGSLDAIINQFDLGAQAIAAVGVQVRDEIGGIDPNVGARLWDACRMQARPRLDDLAQRIDPCAQWEDIVLPESQRALLREIAAHARHRAAVYERWGFEAKGARGLGISALFSGPSGTGKTMAAEVLANELRLDLYHIDLSQIVSKYIGETEKNLRRVFEAAEEGGAILFFDEADALFGKRTEVRDSHDRYANIEVSYLLQRMEAYRGLAILTTNLKSALDSAFLRRIRFIVQFPFPDSSQRAEIWRGIFPMKTPTENLDVEKLARLNVTGGSIRNIALNAAFLAVDSGSPVRMTNVLQATRTEYAKLEKPLTASEVSGWT